MSQKQSRATTSADATAGEASAARGSPARHPGPQVRNGEVPWTAVELELVRRELQAEVTRLTSELDGIVSEMLSLTAGERDSSGDDRADAGTRSFEREHSTVLAQNSQDLLTQSQHALQRIQDGSYGTCEGCGDPVGKLRLQAFPSASLCIACKQGQERH